MVEEFDLTPVAYVTTSHAPSHFFLQNSGNLYYSYIFLEFNHIESTLVKGGKIIKK